jgi:hypothetical protein
MFLYYPGHRHVPPPLRAFIDTLKTLGIRRRRVAQSTRSQRELRPLD